MVSQSTSNEDLSAFDVCIASRGVLVPRFSKSQSQSGRNGSLVAHAVVPDAFLDIFDAVRFMLVADNPKLWYVGSGMKSCHRRDSVIQSGRLLSQGPDETTPWILMRSVHNG